MNDENAAFRVISVFDEEAVPVADGELAWVPLRRRLGIAAFGTNAYRAARAGDLVIEEHVESPGQEEMYVVIKGRARFVVDAEEIDAPAGTAVFVSDPELKRRAEALEDDTVVLAVGGWPGQAYHSLPWEPIYLAQEAMRREDWATAAETLEREAGEHLETGIVQYRLACCHARLGEHEKALAELRRAIEVNPRFREMALEEEHLASLWSHPAWEPTRG
jgi:tetratricopeptide (TPR) repeat protein